MEAILCLETGGSLQIQAGSHSTWTLSRVSGCLKLLMLFDLSKYNKIFSIQQSL